MHSASVLRPHLMEHLRHPLKTLSRTTTNGEEEDPTSTTTTSTTTSPKRAGTFPLAKTSPETAPPHDASRSATPPIPSVTKATTLPLNPSHTSHSSASSTNSASSSAEKHTAHPPAKHSPESFYAAIHEGNSARSATTVLPGPETSGQEKKKKRDRRASKTSVVDSASLLGVL